MLLWWFFSRASKKQELGADHLFTDAFTESWVKHVHEFMLMRLRPLWIQLGKFHSYSCRTYPLVDLHGWHVSNPTELLNHHAHRDLDEKITSFMEALTTMGLGWSNRMAKQRLRWPHSILAVNSRNLLKNQAPPTPWDSDPCFPESSPGRLCIKVLPHQTQ